MGHNFLLKTFRMVKIMKFSKYIVHIEDEGKVIIYNTANSGTARIDKELFEKIQSSGIENLSDKEYDFLSQAGFIVPDDYDEKIIRNIEKNIINSGVHLTFITTEDCNFRCPYCYENHKKDAISIDVYDRILIFLQKTNKDFLSVSWFGGEPTLKMKEIEYFMYKVKSLNKFKTVAGSITTNGFLLSKKNFKRLIECGVNFFQVTIDGVKEEHDKFRHLQNGAGTFDTIVSNLKDILRTDYDFYFLIRNNYNQNSDLVRYVEFIYSIIGIDKRFKIIFASTGTWSSDGKDIPVSSKNHGLEKAYQRAKELGLSIEESAGVQNSFCCANLEDSYVVNYKGELLKCTVKLDWDKNIIGHISENGEFIFNDNLQMWRSIEDLQKCQNCNVRPLCMCKYCPHIDYSNCQEQKQVQIKSYLKRKYC